jgi:hypothetical protein
MQRMQPAFVGRRCSNNSGLSTGRAEDGFAVTVGSALTASDKETEAAYVSEAALVTAMPSSAVEADEAVFHRKGVLFNCGKGI